MKATSERDLLSQQIAILAKERAPKAWDPTLTAVMVTLGKNGYSESDVIGHVLDACTQNGHLGVEKEPYIKKRVRDGLAEGLKLAESMPSPHSNGKNGAGKPPWRDYSGNNPRPTFQNAKIALQALGISPRYDAFHDRSIIECGDGFTHDVNPLIGEVSDAILQKLRHLIDEKFGFDVGESNLHAAVQALAIVFNPVKDMIDQAQAGWDKTPRLDRMAADYLSAEDTELNSAAVRKHMIAAIRRVRDPGCKYDVMVVLEGAEGWNKSTAIRTIAGPENFSDEQILGAKGKEAMELLRIVWHHECAELTGIRKAEVEHVKAFLSRTWDMHRKAYGRVVERQPRHSVEWGTTNDSQYLVSQTGNRRFAPLRLVRSIDLDKLTRDRLQLIGEAAHYEAEGESLFIPESLWGVARIEQEKRREPDPWESKLANIPESFIHLTADGREQVSFSDIMTNIMQIPAAQQTAAMGKRIAQAMEINGWQRPANPIKINGRSTRGYWRYKEQR